MLAFSHSALVSITGNFFAQGTLSSLHWFVCSPMKEKAVFASLPLECVKCSLDFLGFSFFFFFFEKTVHRMIWTSK